MSQVHVSKVGFRIWKVRWNLCRFQVFAAWAILYVEGGVYKNAKGCVYEEVMSVAYMTLNSIKLGSKTLITTDWFKTRVP